MNVDGEGGRDDVGDVGGVGDGVCDSSQSIGRDNVGGDGGQLRGQAAFDGEGGVGGGDDPGDGGGVDASFGKSTTTLHHRVIGKSTS